MPVATPISQGRKPIQVRADALRTWEAPFDTRRGFALMPEEPATESVVSPATSGEWRDADLERAIAVAEQADLRAYRVEIAPDGTISIIVGDSAD